MRTRITIWGLIAVFLGLTFPSTSMAIPAFARKYGSDCNLCHYPNVPRLNSYGHRFRRAGYRAEDEMNQDQEVTKVGNFLSARGRVRYQADFPDHASNKNEFKLNDVTIFYSGAVTKHLSAYTETEVGQDGEVEVLATAHGILGDWDNFATARVGQMHTLTRVGFGGLDRPTGISSSGVLGRALTDEVPFRITEDQRGLELTYVCRDSRVIAQVLNGINGSQGDGRSGDADQDKDYVLAFEQIIDDVASGATAFAYRGVWHDGKGPSNRFNFWRFGVTGNKVFDLTDMAPLFFELQGGYVRSRDEVPNVRGSDVSGNAFFLQAEQNFRDCNFTTFERYDFIDPHLGAEEDNIQIGTVGVVAPIEEYFRVALEGSIANFNESASSSRRAARAGRDLNDYRLLAEVMFNF